MTVFDNKIFFVQKIKIYNICLLVEYLWIRHKVFCTEYKRSIIQEFSISDVIAEHYVVLLDKKIIGTVRVIYKSYIAEIGRIAILKEYRNKGYGTKLINQIIANIKNNNIVNSISLFTIDNNSIAFYKKFGFIEKGEVLFDNVPYMNMMLRI